MKRRALEVGLGVLMLGLLSCGDINVYITFEAPKAEKAIQAINDQVYGTKPRKAPASEDKEKTEEGGKDQGLLPRFPFTLAAVAHAGEADIKIETPAIKALNKKRADRLAALDAWKEKGVIGEANDGYAARVPDSKTGSIKETKEVNDLISAENQDRRQILEELLKANKWPAEDLPKLQEIFAKDMRERAAKGHWIQKPDGKWEQKDVKKEDRKKDKKEKE